MLVNSRVQLSQLPRWCRSLSTARVDLPNLQLKTKIETSPKDGSFMREFFFNRIDPRILAWPKVIVEEEEFKTMKSIPDILKQNVNSLTEIADRSCTEIAIIYEAAGRMGVPNILDRIQHTMSHSMLDQVKRNIPQTVKVGYGYTEREDKMGALSISDWESIATFNEETSTWHLKGTKTMLLDEPYEKYIIFCKNHQIIVEGWPADRPPPTAYAAFLLDKSHVNVSHFRLGEISFQKIDFDVSVPEDCILFHPAIERGDLLRSKAVGHLALSSWILGRLKEYYQFTKPRPDGAWVYSIHLTALDALVYYVAGLMDSFEGADFELEGLSLKVNAMEMAEKCTQYLQLCNPDCRSSNYGLIGTLNDSFNLADLFYESNDRAKLLLGLEGISYLASYEHDYLHKLILHPLYPELIFTRMRKWFDKKFKRNAPFIAGYFLDINSNTTRIIEKQISYLSELTRDCLIRHSKEVLLQQLDVKRLGHCSALILKMLASHARADYTNMHNIYCVDHIIVSNHHVIRDDENLCREMLWKIALDHMQSGDAAVDKVHHRAMKYGGYWAYSPLDKALH